MLNGYVNVENIIFYRRGRDALFNALNLLSIKQGDTILLPAYLCQAVIEPIKRLNINIRFYRIDKTLSLDLEDLKTKIKPDTKAILLIHYFGFPQAYLNDIIKICREQNLYLIEDCAQGLFSKLYQRPLGTFGDIAIFSFKKSLDIPDGAVLAINNDMFKNKINNKQNIVLEDYIYRDISSRKLSNHFKRYLLRYKWMRFIIDKIIFYTDFFRLNPKSKISPDALKLLNSLDIDSIVFERRENFKFILDGIKNIKNIVPVFDRLEEGVCPLIFPFYTSNRDYLYAKLLKSKIMPLILWEFLPREIKERDFCDCLYISKNILGLPIDQSIDRKDLKKALEVLKN